MKILQDIRSGITKTIKFRKGNVGNKKGWVFDVFFDNRKFPNIISALYKTKQEAIEKSKDYIYNDKLESCGSAE